MTLSKGGLAPRVIKGAGWVFGSSGVSVALRLATNLFMVRFLPPDAFGLMAFALLAQMAVEQLTDIGIGQSIVRERDGDTPRFLRVAWTVQMIRSLCVATGMLLIAVGIYFIGPHIGAPGSVYGRAEAPVILAFLSIAAILHGAASTKIFLMQRQLAYGRISMIQLGSQFAAFLFMVVAVQFSPTVWVLLAGALLSTFCRFGLSHMVLPGPRMRFVYDREVSGRLWVFGKWIMASSALNYVAGNADKLILGGLLGAATFGVYSVANVWIQGGLTVLQKFSSQVGYAAFSETLNKRPGDLSRVFGRYMRVMTIITLFGATCCVILAQPFISFLYPASFDNAGQYLQLMAPTILLFRFKGHMDVIMATGNSQAIALISLARSVAVCTFTPIGYYTAGPAGAITGAILANAIILPYVLHQVGPFIRQDQLMFEWIWYAFSLTTVPLIFLFVEMSFIS